MRMLAAQQEVPLHPLVAVTVRLDSVRGQFTVQQERKGQCEHFGFAGAVVAAQQEPAIVEMEFLDIVVEQVDQPRTQWLPSLAVRGRQVGRHLRLAFLVDRSVGLVRIVGACTA
jgi:hypothetical protein